MTADIRRAQTIRHDSDLGNWELTRRLPDPRLRHAIVGPYHGWIEHISVVMRRREMPVVMVPVILNLGTPFGIFSPGTASERVEPFSSFVAGLHDRYAITEAKGISHCLQVNFTPIGAHLFGLPLRDIARQIVSFEEVVGTTGSALLSQLRDRPNWDDRFDLLDRFILRRFDAATKLRPDISWALQQLEATQGSRRISAIAGEIGISPKRLIGLFQGQLGLPPKVIGRIFRFVHVARDLAREDGRSLVELAQDCGYYDQAHFNRDFKAFAGLTPNDFLDRQLPDVADLVEV